MKSKGITLSSKTYALPHSAVLGLPFPSRCPGSENLHSTLLGPQRVLDLGCVKAAASLEVCFLCHQWFRLKLWIQSCLTWKEPGQWCDCRAQSRERVWHCEQTDARGDTRAWRLLPSTPPRVRRSSPDRHPCPAGLCGFVTRGPLPFVIKHT